MGLYVDINPMKWGMDGQVLGCLLLQHPDKDKVLYVIPEEERVKKNRYWDCPSHSSFHLKVVAGKKTTVPEWLRTGLKW